MTQYDSKQLRHLFDIVSGATPESNKPEYWDGDIAWVTPEDVGSVDGQLLRDTRRKITADGYQSCGTRLVDSGAIVLTKRAPIGQVAVLGLPACSNQGCFLLAARDDVDARYYYYFLSSMATFLQALGRGSTFMELSTDDLKSLHAPNPNRSVQKAIACFLDRETSRIDALSAAKQRQLDLIAEKRKAMIASAVTRGLDPTVSFRSTDVEWIPEVPGHWRRNRVGRLFRRIKRLGFPELTVLSVYREFGVIERASRDDNANRIPEDLDKYQLVEAGDLVINKMKAWQGSLGISKHLGITSPDYVVFRPTHVEDRDFLHLLLRMPLLTTVYLQMSNGIRINQWRIEPDRFAQLDVFLPPVNEQKEIVKFLDRELVKLDGIREATERTIALLNERRSALIAAAVTGRIQIE